MSLTTRYDLLGKPINRTSAVGMGGRRSRGGWKVVGTKKQKKALDRMIAQEKARKQNTPSHVLAGLDIRKNSNFCLFCNVVKHRYSKLPQLGTKEVGNEDFELVVVTDGIETSFSAWCGQLGFRCVDWQGKRSFVRHRMKKLERSLKWFPPLPLEDSVSSGVKTFTIGEWEPLKVRQRKAQMKRQQALHDKCKKSSK